MDSAKTGRWIIPFTKFGMVRVKRQATFFAIFIEASVEEKTVWPESHTTDMCPCHDITACSTRLTACQQI